MVKKCKTCGKEMTGRLKRNKLYCSRECRKSDPAPIKHQVNKGRKQSPETIAKRIANTDQKKKEAARKNTMLERYGVDNIAKTEEHQQKIIDSKRRNGTLKHTEEAKRKMSEAIKTAFSDPNFDRSVFVRNSRNINHKNGYVNGIFFRSSYEEKFLRFCEEYHITVETAETKDHGVPYVDGNGNNRVYFPDFYLPDCDTTIEVKPYSMLEVGLNPLKFEAALHHKENFVILEESDGFFEESEWQEFYETTVRGWYDSHKHNRPTLPAE